MQREHMLRQIGSTAQWDVLVVGGGATGLGTALEAVTRGYKTLLLEAHDFAKGTSSRSTKLVHGGVRYLQQGNLKLVREALRERAQMIANAPHIAHPLTFVIPAYAYWELPFYGAGLTAYDLLAGRRSLGHSRILSSGTVSEKLPTVARHSLKGGILYSDGQFDDARYAIALLRTFLNEGGTALNYANVTGIVKRGQTVSGAVVQDTETGAEFEVAAKVLVNATGIFSDHLRCMDDSAADRIITVSQGSHVVLPREFLPGNSALMVPRTTDGRVLFAIPWHGRVLVGTTDDPVPRPDIEPIAMPDEKQFLLAHIAKYLGRLPASEEIASVWSGQRPLVRQSGAKSTAALSRDHTILVSPYKLITVTGGKWTTYRKMGEDVVDRAAPLAGLKQAPSRTASLKLHGWSEIGDSKDNWGHVYGTDLPQLLSLAREDPAFEGLLHPKLPFRRCESIWAVRNEMARTLEDVLARRTRALFLDARASWEAAPDVARLIAPELGRSQTWQKAQVSEFRKLAEQYIWSV